MSNRAIDRAAAQRGGTERRRGATTALQGGCACGAVRYRLRDRPLIVHACHCRDCQPLTGGAFAINLWIEPDLVERRGPEPQSFRLTGGSGKSHDVFFCGACGTTLWSRYAGAGDALFVRAGTLDRPETVRPDVHIYTRSKLPWLELPRGERAFATYYRTASVWTAESRERLKCNRTRSPRAAEPPRR